VKGEEGGSEPPALLYPMSDERIRNLINKIVSGTKPRAQLKAYVDFVHAITDELPDELPDAEKCFRIPILRFHGEIKVMEHFLDNGLFPLERSWVHDRLQAVTPKWKDFLFGYGLKEDPLPALDLVEMVWPMYRMRCPMFTDHCVLEECKPVDCHSMMRYSNAEQIFREIDEKWLHPEGKPPSLSLLTWLRSSYFGGPFGYRRSAGVHVPSTI
jgi:hypothetical protein